MLKPWESVEPQNRTSQIFRHCTESHPVRTHWTVTSGKIKFCCCKPPAFGISLFVEKLELSELIQEPSQCLVFTSLTTFYCFPISDNWGGKVGGPGENKGCYYFKWHPCRRAHTLCVWMWSPGHIVAPLLSMLCDQPAYRKYKALSKLAYYSWKHIDMRAKKYLCQTISAYAISFTNQG